MKHRTSKSGKTLKFALLSLILTVILCAIFALIVHFGNIEESMARTVVFGIMIFSVLVGAFLLAKSKRRSGLVNGLLMSVVYFIVIMLISAILGGKVFSLDSLSRFAVLAAAGMLGGIVGVNM